MNRLLPLDPLTLTDPVTAPVLPFDGGSFLDPIFSADGSAAACLDAGQIVVLELRTNRARAHFSPHGDVSVLALSRDGSRLVAATVADAVIAPHLADWETFVTAARRDLAADAGSTRTDAGAGRADADPGRVHRVDARRF